MLFRPEEKIWTYKCEGDKCVRYHYPSTNAMGKKERRIPFMTCSMTCGEINIWPHPTIRTAVSSKSLKFSVDIIELHVDTPFRPVDELLHHAYDIFIKDLRRIQRLDLSTDEEEGKHMFTEKEVQQQQAHHQHNRRHADVGQSHGSINKDNVLSSSAMFSGISGSSTRTSHRSSDIETFKVFVEVHKFSDINLNFDTDESYQLNISCKLNIL